MARRRGIAVVAVFAGVLGLAGAPSSAAFARPAVPAKNPSGHFAGDTAAFSPVTESALTLSNRVAPITCTSGDNNPDTYFIGLESGDIASYVSIEEGCIGTSPLYFAGIVADGSNQDPNNLYLSAGDRLKISIRISATAEALRIVDTTSKTSLSYGGNGFSATGAEIICYGEGQGSFPAFSKAKFSGIDLNDAAFSASHPTAYNQVDPSGNLQLSTSHLTKTGKGFTIKYVSNQ